MKGPGLFSDIGKKAKDLLNRDYTCDQKLTISTFSGSGLGSNQSMASQSIESHREGAEVYHGDALCKKKSVQLLQQLGLPDGLFPLDDIQEFGHNKATGFIWLVQKKKKDHTFKQIKRQVSYAAEVTAIVEDHKMKKMTGVKTKELLLWLSVVEMYIDDPSSGKITFKTGTGLSDSFPATAFELHE